MAIKLRRGLESQRTTFIPDDGEIIYTTDTRKIYVGDGLTPGGNEVGGTTAAELLKTEVHNATGATLTAAQVVYLSGNTGNKPNAVLAKADAESTSSKTIGLIIANIANNANGYIATDGLLDDLNTSMFVAGDMLWLSDSIAGGVTTIIPDTPSHAVFIGYVTYAHPTNGEILIHIQNGYELNELHDVKITSVANGDGLIYDTALGYWKNSDTVTTQGNTFNAANKLVQLDASAKLPAVDGSQLTNLPSFSPPNGLLKLASAISTTFQAVTDYLGAVSVLFLNSRRVGIGKDTSVTTQSVAVVEVQDANTSIVIKPNGTGAIIASVPDGTATGGNARASGSTDFSRGRILATSVASGNNSSILGGYNNRASGASSCVAGGDNNVSSGGYTHTVGSQNTASSDFSTIGGGQYNTASTNTHAIVVGGFDNTSSGYSSISGGQQNTASNDNCIALGRQNTASGIGAVAIGGYLNSVTGYRAIGFGSYNSVTVQFGIGLGHYTKSYIYGQVSFANGSFGNAPGDGDAQQSLLTARKDGTLTTGQTSSLSLDGTGTTNLIIPNGNNRAWNVQIDTIAVVTAITGTATGVSVGDCYRETKQLLFKRIGGTSSIVGSVDTNAIKSDTSMSTASITISAGASQQMAITFTAPSFAGGGSVTCRVVSKVSLVEVAY